PPRARSARPDALMQRFPMSTHALDQPLAAQPRARAPRWRLRILVGGLVTVLVIVAMPVGLAWRASDALMSGPPSHYDWSLAQYPALARVSQPVTVHSATGATLVGRFFPGRTEATIVLSHG